MFAHVWGKHILPVLAIACLCGTVAFGADRRPIEATIPILMADDPGSIALIDGPWGQAIYVRVVTLSDVRESSLLTGADADPTRPARVATTIFAPDGQPVHLNLVEIGQSVSDDLSRRSSTWVVNAELPFSAGAELAAALEGRNVRRSNASRRAAGDVVCHVTGVPIVELFVWFDPDVTRAVSPNYGVQVVVNPSIAPEGGETDAGESLRGDGTLGGFKDGWGNPEAGSDGDGADPIGSPDQIQGGS